MALHTELTSRYNNFNFFRFLLAGIVIFSHSYAILYGNNLREPVYRLTHGQAESGAIAVDFFFAISGFLITQSWQNSQSCLSFFRKRILRIYPGFVIALLFCVAVIGPLETTDLHSYFRDKHIYLFFKPLFLLGIRNVLPGVFSSAPLVGQVNSSTWTIPYEIFCYILVALIGVMGFYRRRYLALLLFLFVFFWYNFQVYFHVFLPHLPADGPPRLVTFFLSGVLFYVYRDQVPRFPVALIIAVAAVVLSTFAGMSFLFPIFGTYLLLVACFSQSLKFQHFGQKADISYGLYLYAFPIQQVLVGALGSLLNPITLFVLSFLITFCFATASWNCIEKPFLNMKDWDWMTLVSRLNLIKTSRSETQA